MANKMVAYDYLMVEVITEDLRLQSMVIGEQCAVRTLIRLLLMWHVKNWALMNQ